MNKPVSTKKTAGLGQKRNRDVNTKRILTAAEQCFAQLGFKGATMQAIADLSGIPKANLHYYFSSKEVLYRKVIEDVCEHWLAAAHFFDETDDPAEALAGYIGAKMDQARNRPNGSKVWAMEMLSGAPVIDGYLQGALKPWLDQRTRKIEHWISQGKMDAIDPRTLFYMIWATTQHYADFSQQIYVLNDNKALSDGQFEQAKQQVSQIILVGVGLGGETFDD